MAHQLLINMKYLGTMFQRLPLIPCEKSVRPSKRKTDEDPPPRGAAGSSSSTCGGMTGHDTTVMAEVEISINVITDKVCVL